jgi:23S rRNA-/tRNA-specific pseudouridylate synthase
MLVDLVPCVFVLVFLLPYWSPRESLWIGEAALLGLLPINPIGQQVCQPQSPMATQKTFSKLSLLLKVDNAARKRLYKLLGEAEFEGSKWMSRNSWSTLFQSRLVTSSDGSRQLAPNYVPSKDMAVEVSFPHPFATCGIALPPTSVVGKPVAESKRLLAVSKPSGMHTIAQHGWETDCLVNHVAAYLHQSKLMDVEQFAALSDPPIIEGGFVQRLDGETSGLVVCALDKPAKVALRQAFKEHRVEKTYLAITETLVPNPPPREHSLRFCLWGSNKDTRCGAVEQPATPPADGSRVERVEIQARVLQRAGKLNLVQVTTKDGSRHVVRCGLQLMGTPVLGDKHYNPSVTSLAPRFLLHAFAARFPRVTDAGSELVLPESTLTAAVPDYFQQIAKQCKFDLDLSKFSVE